MEQQKNKVSVGKKLFIIVVLIVLCAGIGVCVISYLVNASQIDKYFKNLTINTAQNFSRFVDADFLMELRDAVESDEYQMLRNMAEDRDDEDMIREYLETKGLWDRYEEHRSLLTRYLKSMKDIKYLYIIVWGDMNADHDMYLIDELEIPIYETGYYEEREKEFEGTDPTKSIKPVISNGDWGWLCSGYAPVYDNEGNIVCHIGCDVDMNEVFRARRLNFVYVILGTLVFSGIVLFASFIFVNKMVVRPLQDITEEMKRFSPEANRDYKKAGVINLDINSGDEIEDIYHEIHSMQVRIIDYIDDITKIQHDKEEAEKDSRQKDKMIGAISREAYKDSLTGIGNKTAYQKKADELNEDIARDEAEFAIVMVDANNLKNINDSYGHAAGDEYIKGICYMVCQIYKHSPVFRVGGDEFVVTLTGEDYRNREYRYTQICAAFVGSYHQKDKEPWECYSAAVGMADYMPGDENVDSVFARADRDMYNAKQEFKCENNIEGR